MNAFTVLIIDIWYQSNITYTRPYFFFQAHERWGIMRFQMKLKLVMHIFFIYKKTRSRGRW